MIPEKIKNILNQGLEKLKNMEAKQLYFVLIVLFALIFILDYLVFMGPQLTSSIKFSSDIRLLSDKVQKIKDNSQRIPQYKTQIDDLKMQLQERSTRIKTREEVSIVLEQISKMAEKHGVDIDQIASNFSDQEDVTPESAKDKVYYKVPITVEAKAGYHDFARFLNKIETQETHLHISEFSIAYDSPTRKNFVRLILNIIFYEELDAKEGGVKK